MSAIESDAQPVTGVEREQVEYVECENDLCDRKPFVGATADIEIVHSNDEYCEKVEETWCLDCAENKFNFSEKAEKSKVNKAKEDGAFYMKLLAAFSLGFIWSIFIIGFVVS